MNIISKFLRRKVLDFPLWVVLKNRLCMGFTISIEKLAVKESHKHPTNDYLTSRREMSVR